MIRRQIGIGQSKHCSSSISHRNKSGNIWENRIFRTIRSQNRAEISRPQSWTDSYFSGLTAEGKTDPLTCCRRRTSEDTVVRTPTGIDSRRAVFFFGLRKSTVASDSSRCWKRVEIPDMHFPHWSTTIGRKSYKEKNRTNSLFKSQVP